MFGATGDLARRKLLPGLLHLSCSKLAPEMRVIGTSLDELDTDGFRKQAAKACKEFAHHAVSDELFDQFIANLSFVSQQDGPEALANAVAEQVDVLGGEARLLHYLSVPPKAVMPVDLFGQSADHESIAEIAEAEGLFVLDDAAQAFGASYKGRRLGTSGLATATSFFPAKPLGCFGDGGAIFTDDAELAETLRSIRVHGQGSDKYDNVRLGLTGRLDTIQAAILIEKLKIFEDEIAARNKVAERYAQGLGNAVGIPRLASGCTSEIFNFSIRIAT